jgi:ribosome-associated toxin RatA of RatAB toxin-antitoxin module
MARVAKSVLVGFSAQRMAALVEDVPAYPQFLPWCRAASAVTEEAGTQLATIHIDYHHLRQSFTTRNRRISAEAAASANAPLRLEVELVEGPFRRLQGHWRFTPLREDACRVELELEYEFASRLAERFIAPVFGYIANTLVDAFVRRAEQLYALKVPK